MQINEINALLHPELIEQLYDIIDRFLNDLLVSEFN